MTLQLDSLRTDSHVRRYDSVADMIGDPENPTPLVRLHRVVPDGTAELFVKLEWTNPFGSIKDRTAKWLVDGMRRRGELDGRTIVEPTSGNTGIALAAMAALLGTGMVAVVPGTMPAEKSVLLRALGAEVSPTPERGNGRHPMDVAIDTAHSIVESSPDGYAMPNQYENADNVAAHRESTGPEIWLQTDGHVRYFFAGFGTCGTLTGVGSYLKEQSPDVRIIAIEPVRGHHISGLKNLCETSVPGILDRSCIDDVVTVSDAEALDVARRLHREEALFAGASSSAIIAGALRYLAGREGLAVAVAPDSSMKAVGYLTEMLGG